MSAINSAMDIDLMGELFLKAIDETTPKFIVKSEINHDNYKWFNKRLQSLRILKIRKHTKAVLCNSEVNWRDYKLIRNKYKSEIKKCKELFIKQKVQCSTDQKIHVGKFKKICSKRRKM